MGHYTGVAFRLPVLKTTPLPVLEFFDKLFYDGDSNAAFKNLLSHFNSVGSDTNKLLDPANPVMQDIDYFSAMVNGHNAWFETWYQNIKEETDTTILYETYHSCKFPNDEFTLYFLNGLLPALDLKEGDIVYRTIYEEGSRETIMYLKDSVLVLSDTDGWVYDNGSEDPVHPTRFDSVYGFPSTPNITKEMRNSRDEVHFDLPWNVVDLKAALRIEEDKRLDKHSQRWW